MFAFATPLLKGPRSNAPRGLLAAGVFALIAGYAAASFAADPITHPLSREHVNLVRVKGRKITDVVYDTRALEISADKARGIVFVRVKTAWLSETDSDVTSAFFNTDAENFAVQFVVSAVPSQTIDLTPAQTTEPGSASDNESRIALAAPLMRLPAAGYLDELKTLVRHRYEMNAPRDAPGVGEVLQGPDESYAELPAPEGAVLWEGFRVRQTRAFVTADKLVETLVFTRVSPKASIPDAALLVQAVPGVLACARELRRDDRDRVQTEIMLVRARQAAVRGADAFESALTELSGAAPSLPDRQRAAKDKQSAQGDEP